MGVCAILLLEFQFHKGTIKTVNDKLTRRVVEFQFHKGTIKTQYPGFLKDFDVHFNSIKVRLKPFLRAL